MGNARAGLANQLNARLASGAAKKKEREWIATGICD
jgi:hypothetical protein